MTSTFTPEERMESVKGGAIAAVVTLSTSLLWNAGLVTIGLTLAPSTTILNVAVTTFCGFLFGVTYRYIMRQDSRSHLKSGAVGGFALVRGLSQIEGAWTDHFSVAIATPLLESFAVFALAQIALDQALHTGWLRPFSSD